MRSRTKGAVALLAALAAAGCGGDPVPVNVRLITKACVQGKSPLEKVGSLKFTVTGLGMAPITATAAVGEGSKSIPAIPPGKARRIIVEGISANSAATRSVGTSAFFDINGDEETAIDVPIFVRAVDQFSPTNDAADAGKCTSLATARAGHTATLLNDGRVLIVGGYTDRETSPGSGVWVREYLSSAEIYDPRTGKFTETGPLKTPRAYHTATKLKDSGNVLIVGGETKLNDAPGPLQSAEIFDVRTGTFGRPILLQGGARTRHTATQDPGGRIFIAGGASGLLSGNPEPVPATLSSTTTWYDPTSSSFKDGPTLQSPRVDHAAVLLHTGHAMLIGGFDGEDPLDTVVLFLHRAGQFDEVQDAALQTLRIDPRQALTAVLLPEENASRVVVAGGIGTFGITKTAQYVDVLQARVESIPGELASRRARHCAVPLMNDAVLVAGGRGKDTTASPETSQLTADVIHRDPGSQQLVLRSVPPGDMRDARYDHTCTVMQDGTVLVVGGVKLTVDGKRQALASAEVYQPQLPAQ